MQLQSCPREWERGTSGGEDGWDRMRCHAPSDFFFTLPVICNMQESNITTEKRIKGKRRRERKKERMEKKNLQ
jgi:hypothetical protein